MSINLNATSNNIEIISTIPQTLSEKLSSVSKFSAKALLLNNKIKVRKLTGKNASCNEPILLTLSEGLCFVFPFGVLVLINLLDTDEQLIQNYLIPYLQASSKETSNIQLTETLWVGVQPNLTEGVLNDIVQIQAPTREHLELIANVLSKSIMLELYETTIASNFEHVEPIAKNLSLQGHLIKDPDWLLKHVGATLLAEHNMVGQIELMDKPAFLWEHSELDFLYKKLIKELEIIERQKILDRKIELLSRTTQFSLKLLEHDHTRKLEWYVVILLVVEAVMGVYAIFIHGSVLTFFHG